MPPEAVGAGRTVVVLGASAKPDRYSNMAVRRLRDAGHRVIPVNPALDEIEGLPVVKSLAEIKEPVDTLALYVGPQNLAPLTDEILHLAPERVIFNPGTECPEFATALDRAGIAHIEACTLVMLQTGQF